MDFVDLVDDAINTTTDHDRDDEAIDDEVDDRHEQQVRPNTESGDGMDGWVDNNIADAWATNEDEEDLS